MRVSCLPLVNFVKIHQDSIKIPDSSKIQKTLLVCSLQVRVSVVFFFQPGILKKEIVKIDLKFSSYIYIRVYS